jgi:glycosyltransferase involved in cell wall biosynthesis
MTSINTKDAAPAAPRPPLTADQARVHVREQWLALRTINGNGHASKIAIMGAGRHTSWLQSAVHGVNGPTVVAVLDDVPAGKSHFWGYYPVSPTAWDPTACDAIVLSTDSVAGVMQARLQQVYGNAIKTVNLYEGLPPGPYPKSSPSAGPKPAQPSSSTPIPARPSKWAALLAANQARRDRRDEPYLPDPRLVRREHDSQWKRDYAHYARRLESRFKDCHHGREAILIGNGPSVRTDDFEKFNGFVTFTCNRFYQCYDRTAFRPDYLVTADSSMVSDFGPEMAAKARCPLFINIADETSVKGENVFWLPSTIPHLSPLSFQKTMYRGIYSGGGTLITAIQIGFYMGIRRFYLYGVDHSFSFDLTDSKDKFRSATGDTNHFIANYRDGKAWCPPASHLIEQSFMVCDKALRSNGGFLKNATHGGKLEVLERTSIDQVTQSGPQDNLIRYYNANNATVSNSRPTSRHPRVLMVSSTPSLPAYIGNRVATDNLIRHLLRLGFDVDMVLQNPHFDEEMTENDLRLNYGDRVRVIETAVPVYAGPRELAFRDFFKQLGRSATSSGRIRNLGFRLYCLANRFHPFRYCSTDTLDCASSLIKSGGYQYVIFNYLHFLRIAKSVGRNRMPPCAVITHDAHSRVDRQGYDLGIDTRHRACSPVAERNVLSLADVTVAISSQEQAYFRKLGVKGNVVRSEIDLYESTSKAETRRDSFGNKRLLLVASGNQLNKAGVAAFLDQAWPIIQAVLPAARLAVAGHICRCIPRTAVNVDVLGTLPQQDLLTELRRSTVMINPVFQGTGLKIKSVLALCAGLPMVTVSCGADGLEDLNGKAFVVADNWKDFALACLRLLSDQPLWEDMRRSALEISAARFSEAAVYKNLDEAMGWTRHARSSVPLPPVAQQPRPLLKLLVVSTIPPFPDVQGNRIVLRKLMDHLTRQGAQIDLVMQAQCDPGEVDRHYKGSVRPVFTRPTHFPTQQEKQSREALKAVTHKTGMFLGHNAAIAQELNQAINHFHPFGSVTDETVNTVRALLQNGEYDAIICNYIYALRVVDELKKERRLPPTLVVTHDAMSRLDAQALQHGIDTTFRACSVSMEAACLNVADHVIAITPNELNYFRKAGVKGLLLSEFPAYDELARHRVEEGAFARKIISIAGSANPLNAGGLNAFIESAWPAISQRVPGVQLHVFGALTGTVTSGDRSIVKRGVLPREELLTELSSTTISVNPVLIGTGLKIKSVEAFCMGLPLVSSPVGVEGMEDFNNHGCLIAKDWKEFVTHCAKLLTDHASWQQAQRDGLQLAQLRFSETAVYGEIDAALYKSCRQRATPQASGIFTQIPANTPVLVFGTDEAAQAYARTLSQLRPDAPIVGFIGDRADTTLFSLPVFTAEGLKATFPPEHSPMIVIVSGNSRNARESLNLHGFERILAYPSTATAALSAGPAPDITLGSRAADHCSKETPARKEAPMANQPVLPAVVIDPLEQPLARLAATLRASQWTKIALYGAGKHSQKLMAAWNRPHLALPSIACILDDNASGNLCGIPIVRPADCKGHAPQAIVISSDAFEGKLFEQAVKHNLGTPVLRLYAADGWPNAPVIQALLKNIRTLPSDWHSVGTFAPESLDAIAAFATQRPIRNSMETGAGTSTLLLSHLSQQHTTFALDLGGSITAVKISPLFNAANVSWVEGPSQLTLPRHQFTRLLDFALIDGPHAYPFPDMEYYHIYPHLAPDALLVVDDIHIPTITHLFNFLKEEEMFSLEQVVGRTAFFRRTHAHTFPTQYDGWPLQGFNRKHFPVGNDQAMKARLSSDTQNEIRSWRAKDAHTASEFSTPRQRRLLVD